MRSLSHLLIAANFCVLSIRLLPTAIEGRGTSFHTTAEEDCEHGTGVCNFTNAKSQEENTTVGLNICQAVARSTTGHSMNKTKEHQSENWLSGCQLHLCLKDYLHIIPGRDESPPNDWHVRLAKKIEQFERNVSSFMARLDQEGCSS